MAYRTFDHTADLGVEVEAETLPTLLEEAARAYRELTLAPEAMVLTADRETFAVVADDTEALLVAWLEELLFRWDARGELVVELRATVEGDGPFRATGRGRKAIAAPDAVVETDIKAVTWHAIVAEPRGGGWYARVIFDI